MTAVAEKAIEDLYTEGGYLARNPQLAEQTSPWKARQIKKMLDRHCLTPESVLEIGCGTGLLLKTVAELCPEIQRLEGYDISPQAIEKAQCGAADRLRFYAGDALQLAPEDYAIMLMIDVFEHVEDYLGFLRAARSKARQALFHIPLDMNVQGLLRDRQIGYRQSIGHLHYFSKATALATLEDTGYRVRDWFYTPGALEVDGVKSWKTRLLNLPRRVGFACAPDATVRLMGGWSLLVLADC